jgi:hypothetical protein
LNNITLKVATEKDMLTVWKTSYSGNIQAVITVDELFE